MDPQSIQALMAVFQQGLQILQQAQTGQGMNPAQMDGSAPGDIPPDESDDDDQFAADPGDGGAMPPGGDDDDMDGDGMGSGASLHDRVSQLEGHTGLKKSAGDSGTLSDRISELEGEILGVEYEGPMVERVSQLEKAAGVSAPVAQAAAPATATTPAKANGDAPDEIPLDSLIKAAVQSGIQQGLAAIAADQSDADDDLPEPGAMRKAARRSRQNHYGQRRAAATTVNTDQELAKAAAQFGWSEDELDQPVGFGDMLLMQYQSQQAGEPIPFSVDGDDDDDD